MQNILQYIVVEWRNNSRLNGTIIPIWFVIRSLEYLQETDLTYHQPAPIRAMFAESRFVFDTILAQCGILSPRKLSASPNDEIYRISLPWSQYKSSTTGSSKAQAKMEMRVAIKACSIVPVGNSNPWSLKPQDSKRFFRCRVFKP